MRIYPGKIHIIIQSARQTNEEHLLPIGDATQYSSANKTIGTLNLAGRQPTDHLQEGDNFCLAIEILPSRFDEGSKNYDSALSRLTTHLPH